MVLVQKKWSWFVVMYNFTPALIKNIERTYTFSYARNAFQNKGTPETFNPIAFFMERLKKSPFDAFMALENFAFKATLNALNKYEIPYTPEQERRARVYEDVTQKMQNQRSDYVSLYVDDLEGTGVVLYKEPYVLTTQNTLEVAQMINNLPKNKRIYNTVYEQKIHPLLLNSKEQMEALTTCLKHQVSCLIGGAGTGKSFVTAGIIDQLALNKKNVAILAPTHKAKEALQEKLKHGKVRTIHSFVHRNEAVEDEVYDAIVIDESGMLSTPLIHKLLRNYRGEQLIFVGDKNQLPPVEFGRPFERIQEQFITYELTDNKRSESADIIALGREILGMPQNANMRRDNIQVVSTTREAFELGAEVVLTYTNANVKQVNQEQCIKIGMKAISHNFKVGDKIIAKTNDIGRFFNGQLFKLISPTQAVNKKGDKIVEFKTPKDLEYNFDLAYGLTIHKSQGSEWDVVAYLPHELDTQNLAYVAVTRAKQKLIIVGDGLKSEYPADRKWKQLSL